MRKIKYSHIDMINTYANSFNDIDEGDVILQVCQIEDVGIKNKLKDNDDLLKCRNVLGFELFLEFQYINGNIDEKLYFDTRPMMAIKHKEKRSLNERL